MNLKKFFALREEPLLQKDPLAHYEKPNHTCIWAHKTETYASPRRDIVTASFDTNTLDPQVLQTALLGATTVLEECSICHETRTFYMLGSQNPQLDDMLDKVEAYGPQYLQRNGVTFLFQRYQMPQQQAQIPLR